MSTKVEKSRSELVREYLKNTRSSKDKKPTAVVAALKEKGISVSTGLVSQVKNKLNKKIRRTAKPASNNKKTVSIEHLVHAKHLLQAFEGDVKAARSALETVKKLMSS